jgi:hypothetical protein
LFSEVVSLRAETTRDLFPFKLFSNAGKNF